MLPLGIYLVKGLQLTEHRDGCACLHCCTAHSPLDTEPAQVPISEGTDENDVVQTHMEFLSAIQRNEVVVGKWEEGRIPVSRTVSLGKAGVACGMFSLIYQF